MHVEPGKSVTCTTADTGLIDAEATPDISDDEHDLGEDKPEVPDNISETLSDCDDTYDVGNYVLIKLKAENTGTYKNFVGQITAILGNDLYNVSFMRFKKGKKNIFFCVS